MPKIQRSGQDWVVDRFVASLGIDALMPGLMTFASSPVMGFNPADVRRIVERAQGTLGMRREYVRAARRRHDIALLADAEGHRETARRHYHLAALYYGFAQYLIQEDGNADKARLYELVNECYAKVCEYAAAPIERLEIPFEDERPYEGGSFPGLLHLPPGEGPFPCVVFLPGTDMYKEMIPNVEDNIFAKRGFACLSLDGPGQGESLLRMLKVDVETWNYERAVSAAIDVLEQHEAVDASRIAVLGVSTGSYWSARAAVHEGRTKNRIRAAAGLMAQWESGFVTEMQHQQPAFKTNYMYMAGIDDEAEFDRQLPLNTLDGVIADVRCPILIAQGDYDELCGPGVVLDVMRQMTAPYELWVYEEEFHPMGGVAIESWEETLDWVRDRFEDKPMHEQPIRMVLDGASERRADLPPIA